MESRIVKNGSKNGGEPGTFYSLAEMISADFWFGKRLIFLSSVQVSQRKARDYIKYEDHEVKYFRYTSRTIYMRSWSFEEYESALQFNDESLWKSQKMVFPNFEDKSDAIRAKYFYAGGSARWMFSCDLEEVKRNIRDGLDRFRDAKTVLAGLHGQNSFDSPNSVFQILDTSEDGFPVYYRLTICPAFADKQGWV
jgi:hypothetical protein